MARNEEKAQSMLNRYITQKQEENQKPKQHRPHLASLCSSTTKCEHWRQQIIREISAKVTEIQNDGLPERYIRDLNDEINKLRREKWHWEKRIIELGGRDYVVEYCRDSRGPEYMYFGAARRLPGVRELFEKKVEVGIGPSNVGFESRIVDEDDKEGSVEKVAAKKRKCGSVVKGEDVNEVVKRMVKENEKKKHYLLTKNASDDIDEEEDNDEDDEEDSEDED